MGFLFLPFLTFFKNILYPLKYKSFYCNRNNLLTLVFAKYIYSYFIVYIKLYNKRNRRVEIDEWCDCPTRIFLLYLFTFNHIFIKCMILKLFFNVIYLQKISWWLFPLNQANLYCIFFSFININTFTILLFF